MNREERLCNAQAVLQESKLLENLAEFQPEVVSTLFAGLDTEASDVDIVCYYQSADDFSTAVRDACGEFPDFTLQSRIASVLGRFTSAGIPFEIYGCTTPVTQQSAYRHYKVMLRLVDIGGEAFQKAVRHLKVSGLKTEPAIAKLLKLEGDPYVAVLDLEHRSDAELEQALRLLLNS